MDFIIKLFETICIFAGIAFLIIFIISIVIFRSARKNSDVRMSFKQFRRIYNLSPNKWYCHDDYTLERKDYIKKERANILAGRICISMNTYFDFLCLIIWQWKIDRKEQKEENFKNEMKGLKTLSSMINRDAEEIQRKTQKEMEKLAKKIEEIHSNS